MVCGTAVRRIPAPLRWLRGIEREGEAILASGCVEGGGLLGGGLIDELDARRGRRRRKFAQHRREFELGEERAAGLEVRLLRLHGLQIERRAAHGSRW